MKKVLFLSAIFTGVMFFGGCSESGKETGSVNQVVNNSANNPVVMTNTANNSGVTINMNADANINTANVSPDGNSNVAVVNKIREKFVNSNSNEKPKTTLVSAPYDSGIGTAMSDKGEFLEVRVFNKDKSLQKVERNINQDKITVFLRNGKTLILPAGKIGDWRSASPQEILVAVGVLKPTPTPDASQTGGKN